MLFLFLKLQKWPVLLSSFWPRSCASAQNLLKVNFNLLYILKIISIHLNAFDNQMIIAKDSQNPERNLSSKFSFQDRNELIFYILVLLAMKTLSEKLNKFIVLNLLTGCIFLSFRLFLAIVKVFTRNGKVS